KIHLKFKTAETVESIPDLDFDILSCVAGNKIGRTGEGALPKVKLNWSFSEQGISENSCLEQNSDGIYCDATQFSIMLSKRLKQLNDFFEQNTTFNCPENSLQGQFDEINELLDIDETTIETIDCTFPEVHGFVEGRPSIMLSIEATDIDGTRDIPDSFTFEDTIRFNALLKRDAFTDDFQSDFARHYSDERFFDTPDWFYGLGLDDFGNEYGINTLFEEGRIRFTNKFFDSEALSSAGNYDVLISFTNEDGTYKFFNDAGEPNIWIEIQFELLQEPNPNSVFYSIPLDGLVGLEGDSFNRQGYGVTFDNINSEEFITFNNDDQPLRSFNDVGSNPIGTVEAELETSFFNLNTSPSERGNLITVEKTKGNDSSFKFAPSTATPTLLKMSAEHLSEENLAAFYTLTSSDVPVEVGSVLTYWSGAGACLDNQGVIITEAFDEKPDRAATSKDPIVNWERAYAIDFGKTRETGDVYLRTIFYTNPLEQVKLQAEHPTEQMQFLTADSSGLEVPLNGVSGVAFNNPAGGTQGNVNTVLDVFNLVKDERVCVIDTGRKANFFWNPKAVYELEGVERNISEFTNSLEAGVTCIGLG
ncbi:hypothetical protein IIC68_00735, partial [archaeon]|nr:hypothetical protein [archaeon]